MLFLVAEQLADLHLHKPLCTQQGAPSVFGDLGAGREASANEVFMQPISVGAVSETAVS